MLLIGIHDSRPLEAKAQGKFTCLVFRDPYEAVREFVGTDGMLRLIAEDLALVADMLGRALQVALQMIDLVEEVGMPMDGYWVWGDIASSSGMFFSPLIEDVLQLLRRFERKALVLPATGRFAPVVIDAGNPVHRFAFENGFHTITRCQSAPLTRPAPGGYCSRAAATKARMFSTGTFDSRL